MKNLQLSLIEMWFEMTKLGIKTEDYREVTPYFCNKFLLFQLEDKPKKWWSDFLMKRTKEEIIKDLIKLTTPKYFTNNIMTLGYPKKTNTDRILKYKHKGIELRKGNSKWGAESGKIYFVIKHGMLLH